MNAVAERRARTTARSRGDHGQVLVIFSIGLIALLAAAGLAFDIGRFYTERRFLQNAADAAALAAANGLIRGETSGQADTDARSVLTRNLAGSPTGSSPQLPPSTPVYTSGHSGDPTYLTNGILIAGGEVRVALESNVNYTLGRVVGLQTTTIGAQARVAMRGDLVPIAVRHYLNAPGPTSGASSPCSGSSQSFQDDLSTADTACLGTSTDGSLRTAPSAGLAFDPSNPNNDPAHHGPIVALVGDGASPSNSASFRGFIDLDVRNFASASSNVFYNGVTTGTQSNVLKGIEVGWVSTGYPGPDFPSVTTPPDPNDQVGLMDGNSAGVVVAAISQRYVVGSEILVGVYSGTTMTIPDFSFTVPSSVSIGQTQNRDNAVTMTTSKNASFSGVVTTTAFADWNDSTNPLTTGTLAPLAFSPDPNTPPATVTWTSFHTTAAPVGISTIWIKGHSSSPYLTDHYYPVALNVGSVVRDFGSSASGQVFSIATTGQTATGSITVSTPNTNSTYFGGDVTLSLEGGAASNGILPIGLGPTSISPSSISLENKGDSRTVSVSINGGSLSPGEYPLTIRATGTNSAGQRVTHLIPILLDIATASTSNEYVDIEGFAVFRISSMDSNTVYGYAITGAYADMNDPAVRHGQTARLVPWN